MGEASFNRKLQANRQGRIKTLFTALSCVIENLPLIPHWTAQTAFFFLQLAEWISFSSTRQLDEAFQLPDAGGVAHFPQGFRLDLADALAGDLELAADFL